MHSIAIIGLSSFGFYLCQYLSELTDEIMAVDTNETRVENVRQFVQKAVVADAREKSTLEKLALQDFDKVIISVGDAIDTSVLTTLHLRELGVKEIYAKAVSEDHEKILKLIGVKVVIFPERDMARRIAHTLDHDNLLDYINLGKDYSVVELLAPEIWIGKSLTELSIRRKYHVQVIMIKKKSSEKITLIPPGNYLIKTGDILVLVGNNTDLEKIDPF